jgi:serine/threonine-protein kinase
MSHWITLQLAVCTVLLAITSLSTPAAANDNYGAIAFSQDSGNYGYSYDHNTRAGAERDALNRCNASDCTVVVWFMNDCGALASGDHNGYGTGWASSRGEAENIAMSNCKNESSNCSITCWACTER